jgi:hypothetical protein
MLLMAAWTGWRGFTAAPHTARRSMQMPAAPSETR